MAWASVVSSFSAVEMAARRTRKRLPSHGQHERPDDDAEDGDGEAAAHGSMRRQPSR